jgi:hypothetical protein
MAPSEREHLAKTEGVLTAVAGKVMYEKRE